MNRLLRILAGGLMVALLLSACNSVPTATGQSLATTVTPIPGKTESPTTAPPPPPVTEPTLPEIALPGQQISYPVWQGHQDIDLLAEPDAENGQLQVMTGWRHLLLLSYATSNAEGNGDQSASAFLLNLTTGAVSQAVKLPDGNHRAVFLENGKICLYDQRSCAAKVYDLAGNLSFSYETPEEGVRCSIDPANSGTLWCYSGNSPLLTCVSLDGSSSKSITVPNADGGLILGHRDGVAYYSAYDGANSRLYAISTDGAVSPLRSADGYFWGGGVFYTDGYPNRIWDAANPETVCLARGEDAFSWIVEGVGSHLLVERYADEENCSYLWVIDREKGLRYPALRAEGECEYHCFFSPEEGVYYFAFSSYDAAKEQQNTQICRWNYRHDERAADLISTDRQSIDAQNAAIAEAIRQNWGISVIYTAPQIHQVASDYSTVAITDPLVLQEALLQLEEALSAYPDGFFDDLCYGNYTRLEIYLCGKFTPLTSAGINNAEALSNTRGSVMVMGFDVSLMDGEYVRVLAHELLHIMERRIDQIDVDALGEWIALTPGGHDAYYYSYHDEDGLAIRDPTHTYYYESDPADAYFVDAYSKSFPTEDRARIFEKLMASGGDPYFADSPVLMAKARTLCRLIRQYFPSVAALERASWEIR